MEELKGLDINTKVEIDVDDPDHGGKFLSRVMDMSKKEIKLMAPTDHGEIVYFHKRTPLSVFFVGDRALYSFNSVVTGHFKEPIPGFSIKVPTKIGRIQRREFVRLEVKLHFKYRFVEEANLLSAGEKEFLEGYIVDISGGGIKFHTDKQFKMGSRLEMVIDTNALKSEIIPGKVVRNERIEEGYEIGVAFDKLLPVVQDKIISWIFDKQRDLRRKGLV